MNLPQPHEDHPFNSFRTAPPGAGFLRDPGAYPGYHPTNRSGQQFPGAVALNGLSQVVGDELATLRIVARFTTLRFVMVAQGMAPAAGRPRSERAAARAYVRVLPPGPERRCLRRLIQCARRGPLRELADLALGVAARAAMGGHPGGAQAYRQLAYRLSLKGHAPDTAARAARSIARAAFEAGDVAMTRQWELRARNLDRMVAPQEGS